MTNTNRTDLLHPRLLPPARKDPGDGLPGRGVQLECRLVSLPPQAILVDRSASNVSPELKIPTRICLQADGELYHFVHRGSAFSQECESANSLLVLRPVIDIKDGRLVVGWVIIGQDKAYMAAVSPWFFTHYGKTGDWAWNK